MPTKEPAQRLRQSLQARLADTKTNINTAAMKLLSFLELDDLRAFPETARREAGRVTRLSAEWTPTIGRQCKRWQ